MYAPAKSLGLFIWALAKHAEYLLRGKHTGHGLPRLASKTVPILIFFSTVVNLLRTSVQFPEIPIAFQAGALALLLIVMTLLVPLTKKSTLLSGFLVINLGLDLFMLLILVLNGSISNFTKLIMDAWRGAALVIFVSRAPKDIQ